MLRKTLTILSLIGLLLSVGWRRDRHDEDTGVSTMKIQSVTYRIIVSLIIVWIMAGVLMMAMALVAYISDLSLWIVFGLPSFFLAPLVSIFAFWRLTPPDAPDGHTRCGECGYILKGLTEPRRSECGERI